MRLLAAIVLALAVAAGACGEDEEEPESAGTAGTPAAQRCEKANLETHEPGILTVGTDEPAFPPYFVDDDPSNGKGFE